MILLLIGAILLILALSYDSRHHDDIWYDDV